MSRRAPRPSSPPYSSSLPLPSSSPSRNGHGMHRPSHHHHHPSYSHRDAPPSPPSLLTRLRRSRILRPALLSLLLILLTWRLLAGDPSLFHSYYILHRPSFSPPTRPTPEVRVRPDTPSQPLPLGQTRPRPPSSEEHTFLPSGLLLLNPLAPHPIHALTARAHLAWSTKLARASQTLEQAVAEYKRRYDGRSPPRGFDKWWAFVVRNGVRLPDEYDQIWRDLKGFAAYSPRGLRRLQAATRRMPGTYTLSASSTLGRISLTATNLAPSEEAVGLIRAREQLALLRGYEEVWTDEETGEERSVEMEIVSATGDWEATFSSHDVPAEFGDWQLDEDRRERVARGQTMDPFHRPLTPPPYRGWASACPPLSPLRQYFPEPPTLPIEDPAQKSFIWEHRRSMSPCDHPELVRIVGFLSGHYDRGPGPQEVHRLIFGMCKTASLHSDVLTVASEQWTEDVGEDPPWEEKTDERLVWRGSTTGILNSPKMPWRASQRVRMVGMMAERAGNRSVLLPGTPDAPVGPPEQRRTNWLNTVLTDMAFTREPIQCVEGVCEIMQDMFEWHGMVSQTWQNRFKYVMDIDGNGWSARFKRLITTNSLMLKATIFPEWYMDRIQPWVHYVPIKMDLTDVYDVLTFFRGDVENGGRGGHDEEARRIAEAGREWSLGYFRRVDMVAYMWRLFLEYGRLVSDERDEMDFELPS